VRERRRGRAPRRAGAGLVGAQYGADGKACERDGEVGRTKLRDELGERAGEREERVEEPLERVEALLDGGLARGIALLLRRMLGLELAERCTRGIGHVGSPLVCEGLHAGAVAKDGAESFDDVIGALARVDDDGVEETLIATADVLHADELERDAEGRQGRGIRADLRVGQEDIEPEARPTRSALARLERRRRGRRLGRADARARRAQPVTERPLGERQGLAEVALRERRQLL
jgi:hypothetical protein